MTGYPYKYPIDLQPATKTVKVSIKVAGATKVTATTANDGTITLTIGV